MKDLSIGVLEQDAASRHLFERHGTEFIVVEGLAPRDLLLRERSTEVIVEVAAEGRHPFEAPAHPLPHSLDFDKWRSRDDDIGDIIVLKMYDDAVNVVDLE